jgi:predicted house-cleaning noncanonical NTP pyrophosphatase (MazG superfamily)
MRKLILDNLYENGKITSESAKPIVEKYLKDVTAYTELVKLKLLEEIGYDEVSEGKYEPRDKDSVSKLLGLIRANLEREDAYGNELKAKVIKAPDEKLIKLTQGYTV